MLINESGLVRCIKRAYKSAGYAVAAEGDCMTIYTEQWYIQCKRACGPNFHARRWPSSWNTWG